MTTKRKPGRPATGRVRSATSVSLSADDRARLARWGRSASAAVRAVLAVAEAARDGEDAERLAHALTEARRAVAL